MGSQEKTLKKNAHFSFKPQKVKIFLSLTHKICFRGTKHVRRNRLVLANLKRHVKENTPQSARLNTIVLCLLYFCLSRPPCANNPDHGQREPPAHGEIYVNIISLQNQHLRNLCKNNYLFCSMKLHLSFKAKERFIQQCSYLHTEHTVTGLQ